MSAHTEAMAAAHGERHLRSFNPRRNRLLIRVCAMLLALMLVSHLFAIANMPIYYRRVVAGTVPMVMTGDIVQISNELIEHWAAARNMTLGAYAIYIIAFNLVMTLAFVCAALVIVWKAQHYWFRWFAAFVLVFYPSGTLWQFVEVGRIGYPWLGILSVLWPCYLLFWYLFPNGRAVPRWTRWLLAPLLTLHFALQAIAVSTLVFGTPLDISRVVALFPVVLAAFPIILLCQMYRYVRVSTPTERAQTKWFVVGFVLYLAINQVFGSVLRVDDQGFGSDIAELAALLLPLSLTISILRYRLWDIDIIIRRTLLYGTLTAMLALIYLGSILILQRIVQVMTGSTSQLAIVASTLIIAALFQPLRRRIQHVIDRRFYRRRYDAHKTLEAFSDRLRHETDLPALTDDLLAVVQETLHPAHVSLWLKGSLQPARDGEVTPNLERSAPVR